LIHGFRQVIRDEEGGGTGRLAEGVSRGSDPRIAERAVSDVASPRGHLETLMPGERLFRDLYRRLVDDMHTVRLKALRLANHRVHDARHFYAVRAVRAATPYELVARQLGPPDISKWWLECTASTHRGAMSATDGRRSPQTRTPHAKHSTRKKIEKMGAAVCASSQKRREPTTLSDWLVDSRGATRTRDPGIMSSPPASGKDGPHSDNAE